MVQEREEGEEKGRGGDSSASGRGKREGHRLESKEGRRRGTGPFGGNRAFSFVLVGVGTGWAPLL